MTSKLKKSNHNNAEMPIIARLILPFAFLIACGACNAQSRVADTELRPLAESGAAKHKNKARLEFRMTGFVAKPDDKLIRVKGTLIGDPHTSHRINAARLLAGNQSYVAIDIDGIDFERYFQWEDEGTIPLEIDFAIPEGAKMPELGKSSSIIFSTVHGDYIFDCK